MSRPVIYIAGPISKGDLLHNVRQADTAFLALVQAGFAPINPMLSVYAGAAKGVPAYTYDPASDEDRMTGYRVVAEATRTSALPMRHQDWLDIDLAFVERSDAVLRLPGESIGAAAEVSHAEVKQIPVFYDVAHVTDWFFGNARRSLSHPWLRRLLPPRRNGMSHTDNQLSGWVRRGLEDVDGITHKLTAIKDGGQWMVRDADLRSFLAAVGNAARN
ncbi:hypothetical protein VT84_30775 [Gemmata sp. SH-PL17]|uniref:hypothetical protein n=1 Tax=Gemmata sp. SH-PL17 TaxID=1630693 RepID=UPI00078E3179|nr:hypothetical protein [Gemmata sp. SH-PL17]AMV28818.1 hypothetical protein VT84_30775 [Gemmata sp. SH-PL17]